MRLVFVVIGAYALLDASAPAALGLPTQRPQGSPDVGGLLFDRRIGQQPVIGDHAGQQITVAQLVDAGDHLILIGRVNHFATADGQPLRPVQVLDPQQRAALGLEAA